MQHYCFKRLQKVFLEVIVAELLFEEELVSQLSEWVDSIEGDIEILMRANCIEMLAQWLPNLLPNKSDSAHVKIGDLDQSLQGELPRVVQVCELLSWHLTEISDEVYDSIGVQVYRTLDY